jgi:tagatose-1,6-bisphosphate aldolase
VPFIYLSEGASNDAFLHALELAAEAGVKFSGVLCGRAAWKDGYRFLWRRAGPRRAALED